MSYVAFKASSSARVNTGALSALFNFGTGGGGPLPRPRPRPAPALDGGGGGPRPRAAGAARGAEGADGGARGAPLPIDPAELGGGLPELEVSAAGPPLGLHFSVVGLTFPVDVPGGGGGGF